MSWWKRLLSFRSPREDEASVDVQTGMPPPARHDILTHPLQGSDVISGWKFVATMSPKVPLKVLRHHGDFYPGPISDLPCFTDDRSQGIWVPKTKTFRELGIDIDEPKMMANTASCAGQIDSAQFLPFLIAYREIIEGGDTTDAQSAAIERLRSKQQWSDWLDKIGVGTS